jgi:hypothetical protein
MHVAIPAVPKFYMESAFGSRISSAWQSLIRPGSTGRDSTRSSKHRTGSQPSDISKPEAYNAIYDNHSQTQLTKQASAGDNSLTAPYKHRQAEEGRGIMRLDEFETRSHETGPFSSSSNEAVHARQHPWAQR